MSKSNNMTPEDYLAIERVAEAKSEYIAGEMVARAGASFTHAEIVANIQVNLALQLRDRPCRAVTNDVKVRVEIDKFLYPDVLVTCGEPRFDDSERDVLLNPVVIFEVLSKSTEGRDRGEKFEYYRHVESLTDYLLVSQDKRLVEQRSRQAGDVWILRYVEGIDSVVRIDSIGCTLRLADIYDRINFAE